MNLLIVIVTILFTITTCCDAFKLADLVINADEHLNAIESSSDCVNHLRLISKSAQQRQLWAMKMLDSWGTLPAGRYHGNTIDYGHFDQCIESEPKDFDPLYCLLTLSEAASNATQKYNSAVCVPSTCTQQAISDIFNVVLRNTSYQADLPERCIDHRHREFGIFEYSAITIIVALIVIVVISTCYHLCNGQSSPAFSLIRNFPQLVDTTPDNQNLECLNGLRAITMCWIVVMHNLFYLVDFVSSMYNRNEHKQQRTSFWYMTLLQAQLGADTFLVISGLCVSYNFMRARNKGAPFKLLDFYFHRFIRLTPTKILAMVFSIFVYNVKYGPVYNINFWLSKAEDTCRRWWWSGLLYSQNYINPSEPCLSATWYQHVDVHMFLLSPIFLFGFWNIGYKMLPVVFGVMAISNYSVYLTAFENKFDFVDLRDEYFQLLYVKTHARLSTWMLGMILGYVIHRRMDVPKRWGKLTLTIMWIVLIFHIFYSMLCAWLYLDYNDNLIFTAIAHPGHRIIWGLLICLVIYNCARGHGGAVNWLLKLPMWKPIIRLNYAIFLTHVSFIHLTARLMRKEMHFNAFSMIQMGMGNYLMAFLLAIPITLLVEMPFVNLETDWKAQNRKLKQN